MFKWNNVNDYRIFFKYKIYVIVWAETFDWENKKLQSDFVRYQQSMFDCFFLQNFKNFFRHFQVQICHESWVIASYNAVNWNLTKTSAQWTSSCTRDATKFETHQFLIKFQLFSHIYLNKTVNFVWIRFQIIQMNWIHIVGYWKILKLLVLIANSKDCGEVTQHRKKILCILIEIYVCVLVCVCFEMFYVYHLNFQCHLLRIEHLDFNTIIQNGPEKIEHLYRIMISE